MKRIIAILLAFILLTAFGMASADIVSADTLNELFPDSVGVDLSVFKDNEIFFDNFTFSGEINTDVKFKLKNITFSVSVRYSAHDSVISIEPYWKSAAIDAKYYDIFVVMGQNRYRIVKNNYHEPMGMKGFNLLKEMAEYEGDVQVACVYDCGIYTLQPVDKENIKVFIEMCTQAGIVPHISQDTTVEVITQFN